MAGTRSPKATAEQTTIDAEIIDDESSGKAVALQLWTEDQLREIASFDDALALTAEAHGSIEIASEVLGDGFAVIDNKDVLIGVPFIAMGWQFYDGIGGQFAAIRVVTKDNKKYIVNDGSTGIRAQLERYQQRTGRCGGMYVGKGLRKSTYEVQLPDKNGDLRASMATTYYLDTAAVS
jgi:hypothetical protein